MANGVPDLEAAIATITDSRRTHVEWRDYWLGLTCKGECDSCQKFATHGPGNLEHHERCVVEYDNVLRVLNHYKEHHE